MIGLLDFQELLRSYLLCGLVALFIRVVLDRQLAIAVPNLIVGRGRREV